jgi:N-acetylglucosaminyl-diphospho-decaprenol L-rhamnosyltransferase
MIHHEELETSRVEEDEDLAGSPGTEAEEQVSGQEQVHPTPHRQPATPDLSIVIVTWNTRELLARCLEALPAAVAELTVETWVVDNASGDGTVEMVRERFPEARVIANQENRGWAGGNNQALRQCAGRYLLLLNADTEPRPGSLAALSRFLDEHPDVGACGPMLLLGDGSIQGNGRRFPTFWKEFLDVTGLRHLALQAYIRRFGWGRNDFETLAEVDEVTGSCLLARREAVEQVGLLDEQFFMYYDEVDWCYRMKAAGWRVFYVPEAQVVHHVAASAKQIGFEAYRRLFDSQYRYFRKHASPPTRLAILLVGRTGLVTHRLRFMAAGVKRQVLRLNAARAERREAAANRRRAAL